MNDIHGYVGAYVTNALDDESRRVFDEHLAGCESCSREIREFGETLAELSRLSETAPPPSLRRDVLAEISRTRIEPPPEPVEQQPEPKGDPGDGTVVPITTRTRASRVPRWLTLAVAASLLIAVVFGGWSMVQQRRISDLERAQQTQQQRIDLLRAPDLKAYPVDLKNGSHGTYLVSREQDRALLVGTVAETEPGKDYQLWSVEGGSPVPGSVFEGGPVEVWINGIDRTEAFAITVEPDGGSAEPSPDRQAATPL
jgi:anti-sigma-K factor RskA